MDNGHKQKLQKEFRKYLKTRRHSQKPGAASTPTTSTPTTSTPPPANSHKEKQKKRHTKQKLISKENVPRMKRITDEEAEEFEVVQGAHPAHCLGKRKSKMKWKRNEADEDDDDEKERKDTSGPGSDVKKPEDIVKQIKQEMAEVKSVMAQQMEASQAERDEMEKLLKQIRGPKWNKDKKPKTKKGSQMTKEEMDQVTKDVAARTLEVLKRNQLLEKALTTKENNELAKYFTGGSSHISEEVLKVLDKSMTHAIEKVVNRPEELDDVIDLQMRQLLMNQEVAKNILLEVMLLQPKFIPICWGGRGSINVPVQEEKPKAVSGTPSFSLARK